MKYKGEKSWERDIEYTSQPNKNLFIENFTSFGLEMYCTVVPLINQGSESPPPPNFNFIFLFFITVHNYIRTT